MPGVRYSVFNPSGESYVPETEKFAQLQRGQNMSDWLMKQQLDQQDRQFNANLADTAAGRVYQGNLQRDTMGTFNQRQFGAMDLEALRQQGEFGLAGLKENGATDRARIANEPQMGLLDLQGKEWNDPSAVSMRQNRANMGTLEYEGAQRASALNAELDNQVLGQLRGGQSATGGTMGGAIGPNDLRSIIRHRAGLGEDPADQLARMTIAKRLADAQENGEDTAPYQAAVSKNDMTLLPPVPLHFDQRSAQELGKAQEIAGPEIQGLHDFIRGHNWWVGPQNRVELQQRLDGLMSKLQGLGFSPRALAVIDGQAKQAMRDALKQNGVILPAAGSNATRAELGL